MVTLSKKVIFEKLLILNLKNGSTFQICTHCLQRLNFPLLEVLDASDNYLTFITVVQLIPFNNVRQLHIQNNTILSIQDYSFYQMTSLRYIDLSCNKLSMFTEKTFNGLKNLNILNLTYNNIQFLSQTTFIGITRYVVVSDNGKICCSSGTWAKCKVLNDTLSNCNNLISGYFSELLTWMVAILTTVMNLLSFYVHLQQNSPKAFIVMVLSFCDLFYGMYLILIISVDKYYKQLYIEFDYSWKNSILCRLSSLATLYSWLSCPILLSVIMLARFSSY